jgi:DUF2971 family protein
VNAAVSANRRHDRQHFYKYVTADVAGIILATRRLRWSSPQLFDDPFDVPINLELPFATAELQVAVTHRIATLMESGTPLREPRLAAFQQYLVVNQRTDLVKEIVEEFRRWPVDGINVPTIEGIQRHWERLRPDMRILCMSETPDIPPMWAHYAGNHSGAVLEFACVDRLDSPLLVARKVTYRPDPPRLPPLEDWVLSILCEKPINLTELFSEYEYVKQTHWAYQQEWRVSSSKRPGETGLYSDFPFNPRELSAVLVGSRMPPEDVQLMSDFLQHGFEHVRLEKAVEDQKTLALKFERI